MKIINKNIVGLLLTVAFGAGCQNRLHDQNKSLFAQNRELQDRTQQLETELGQRPDTSQVAALQAGLSERDARIAELEKQLRTPSASADGVASGPGIDGIETEFNRATGEMTVRVPGDVLFDAGVATIKPGARATLDKIAAALEGQYLGKKVRVEGHTDADPLVRTRAQWTDNRGLSSARALAVARYLEGKGVDSKRVVTSGFGEFSPRGSDKSKNRRVEIVVLTR